MAFMTQEQLSGMGFAALGRDVRISDKTSIFNANQIAIGDYSRIDDFCVLYGRIRIGRNAHVTVFCNLAGGTEGITLEDFSELAYHCHVFSQSDDYTGRTMTNPTIPARYKAETKRALHTGHHCIVGASSIILPSCDTWGSQP